MIGLSRFGYVDVFSTVSRLMNARNAQASTLNALSSRNETSISTYGQLQSALSSFQSAVQSLTGDGFKVYTATSSTAGIAAATTTSTSAIGTYAVQVNQLASAQSLTSAGQVSATTAIGTGAATTLTFSFGSTVGAVFTPNAGQTAKTVTINTNNSLDGIASAINTANVGVTAGVSFNGTGYNLTIKGDTTGTSNSMSIGVTGDATLQNLLNYVPGGVQAMTQTVAAQDSQVVVDGVAVSNSTNTLAAAIPGTTLTVAALGATNLTIAPDKAQITSNAMNFVSAYNTLTSTLESLAQSDRSAASSLRIVSNQLSRTLNSTQSSTLAGSPYSAPAQVGITTQANGSLTLDTATLDKALNTNFGNVAQIFSNNGKGIADKFVSQTQRLTGGGSWISSNLSGLYENARLIDSRKTALSVSLTSQTHGLINKYTNLNLTLSQWEQNGALYPRAYPKAPSTSGFLNLFI